MKIICTKSAAFLLLLSIASPTLRATDYLDITTTNPYAATANTLITSNSDGTLNFRGSFVSTAISPALTFGTSARFVWFPMKAALRVGYTNDTAFWSTDNMGIQSIALGYNTMAAGGQSFAVGHTTSAAGASSMAMGKSTVANANYSFAGGYGSHTETTGTQAFAFGNLASASGDSSVSMGQSTSALGAGSVALGTSTVANGASSLALGNSSTTAPTASYSMAVGFNTKAATYGSIAFGRNNIGGTSTATWNLSDPLFELGDGASSSTPSDAFLIDKGGNVTAQGTIRCSPGGDLSMGSFIATPSGVPIPSAL